MLIPSSWCADNSRGSRRAYVVPIAAALHCRLRCEKTATPSVTSCSVERFSFRAAIVLGVMWSCGNSRQVGMNHFFRGKKFPGGMGSPPPASLARREQSFRRTCEGVKVQGRRHSIMRQGHGRSSTCSFGPSVFATQCFPCRTVYRRGLKARFAPCPAAFSCPLVLACLVPARCLHALAHFSSMLPRVPGYA